MNTIPMLSEHTLTCDHIINCESAIGPDFGHVGTRIGYGRLVMELPDFGLAHLGEVRFQVSRFVGLNGARFEFEKTFLN